MTLAIELPPEEFMAAVAGMPVSAEEHVEVGKHVFDVVAERCAVTPDDSILDLGCGCGRVASHFVGFTKGPYHGLDVVLPMIEWCQNNITPRFPNFLFHHSDLKNTYYSASGQDASTYRFPFANDTFDVVFASSVFTHLVLESARQYANEVSRVLKGDGRALLTFFLLNDEKRARGADLSFSYQCHGYKVADIGNPEYVVAFEEADVIRFLESAGLRIETISFGNWSGNEGWTYQDAVLVRPL